MAYPKSSFIGCAEGPSPLMLFKKLPQPDFFSLYQQGKSSIGGTVPFLKAITVIDAR